MSENERLYAVWMLTKVKWEMAKIYKAVRHFTTAESIYRCTEKMFGPDFSAEDIEPFLDKDISDAERIVENCDRTGIKIIPFSSMEYPRAVRDLKDAPCALFVKGKLPQIEGRPSVGMVGTRRASEAGKKTAAMLAYEISSADVLVVSGLAWGIDTYSHKGSLLCGKPTVAVVAGGVDQIYPKKNKELYTYINANGAIISEYLPGTPVRGFMFPMRNRLISALSDAVVVVESGESGGSLITARYCKLQGKPLFAVPGSIFNPMAIGTNRLLKEGANIVTSTNDILSVLNKKYGGKLSITRKSASVTPTLIKTTDDKTGKTGVETTKPKKKSVTKKKKTEEQEESRFAIEAKNAFKLADLSESERKVFGIIAEKKQCSVDAICRACGLTFNEAVVVVSNLELADLIEEVGYGSYSVRD